MIAPKKRVQGLRAALGRMFITPMKSFGRGRRRGSSGDPSEGSGDRRGGSKDVPGGGSSEADRPAKGSAHAPPLKAMRTPPGPPLQALQSPAVESSAHSSEMSVPFELSSLTELEPTPTAMKLAEV